MSIQLIPETARRAFGLGVPISTTLLILAGLTARAQTTSFTATGWINAVQALPIGCTNALGQVLFRGAAYTARVQATDPRVTGQVRIINDAAVNADGTVNMQGMSYLQVGTWDPAGTNFTPNGGLWEWTWNGVMQPDNSAQVHLVGYGSGGTIDGLRIDQTMTRTNSASTFDPTVPLLYTGVIKAAPLNTIAVMDNFDTPSLGRWTWGGTGTPFPLIETNHQFTVRAKYPGLFTHGHNDTWVWPGFMTDWSVANNQTLECRVDLVSMSENATNGAGFILFDVTSGTRTYELTKGRDFVELGKWAGGEQGGIAVLLHEQAGMKNSNVVLSLALTRMDPNVVLTVRVLDKDNQEAVLYQGSVVDTPAADRTLTSEELLALSGMKLDVWPDTAPPLTSGNGISLSAWQYTDGQQPEMYVTYDNLELRTSEVPPVGIERAVRLSWPASAAINYAVEGAPTVQGPWLRVQDQTMPGFQTMTVPATGPAQFFRLIQAP